MNEGREDECGENSGAKTGHDASARGEYSLVYASRPVVVEEPEYESRAAPP
jgi:hypothetical protein